MSLVILILALLIINAVSYYPKFKKHFLTTATAVKPAKITPAAPAPSVATVTPPAPVPPKEIEYQGKLVLNGVFLSEQEKMALIDNQPVHIGDVVEGKKIVSIEMNKIKLQDKDNILILRTIS